MSARMGSTNTPTPLDNRLQRLETPVLIEPGCWFWYSNPFPAGNHIVVVHLASGSHRVFLWTFHRLTTATKLYTRVGFRLTESMEVSEEWGAPVIEQRYDLWL